RVVGDKGVVLRNNAGHQIPILFAAQSQPVHMEAIVAVILSNGHERGVQAFINQELHYISCRKYCWRLSEVRDAMPISRLRRGPEACEAGLVPGERQSRFPRVQPYAR